jgi:prepilin-type N-terminal cleavage/methylation domain-containing protein
MSPRISARHFAATLAKTSPLLRHQHGFTLIELMVVVAIVAILAVIAVRQFTEYRARGFDARANSDLRNAATAEEAYYASSGTYKSGADTGPGASSFLPGLTLSDTVSIDMEANGGDSFTGTAESSMGTKIFTYSYDSTRGTIQ